MQKASFLLSDNHEGFALQDETARNGQRFLKVS